MKVEQFKSYLRKYYSKQTGIYSSPIVGDLLRFFNDRLKINSQRELNGSELFFLWKMIITAKKETLKWDEMDLFYDVSSQLMKQENISFDFNSALIDLDKVNLFTKFNYDLLTKQCPRSYYWVSVLKNAGLLSDPYSAQANLIAGFNLSDLARSALFELAESGLLKNNGDIFNKIIELDSAQAHLTLSLISDVSRQINTLTAEILNLIFSDPLRAQMTFLAGKDLSKKAISALWVLTYSGSLSNCHDHFHRLIELDHNKAHSTFRFIKDLHRAKILDREKWDFVWNHKELIGAMTSSSAFYIIIRDEKNDTVKIDQHYFDFLFQTLPNIVKQELVDYLNDLSPNDKDKFLKRIQFKNPDSPSDLIEKIIKKLFESNDSRLASFYNLETRQLNNILKQVLKVFSKNLKQLKISDIAYDERNENNINQVNTRCNFFARPHQTTTNSNVELREALEYKV